MPTVNSKHVFLGLFGEPGIGKTRLAGSSAALGTTMLIRPAVDHTDSILSQFKGLIDERIVRDWNDMDELRDELRQEGEKLEWVWVDSWSLLQDVLLDDLFETAVLEKPARGRYGPDKQEYGINMYRIGAWMRHVIGPDLFNFGFTAHPATLASPDLDEDGDPVEKLMPWIQGKNMSPKLCGYTNLICFMERAGKNKKRVIRTQTDERFYAKDQFDAFGESGVLWEPTMTKIMEAIETSPGRKSVRKTGGNSRSATTKRPAIRRRMTPKGSK